MKVFRIRLDSNVFQSFLPDNEHIWATDSLMMNCQPKLQLWNPPSVHIGNPTLKKGNFFHLCSGAFVVDAVAAGALRTILEWAGELLPLPHESSLYHLINVLECANCLDDDKTKWVFGKTSGARLRIKEYHFHPSRLTESSLFKIHETAMGEVLTVSGMKDPEDEFKSVVEQQKLEGILFEEIWSD